MDCFSDHHLKLLLVGGVKIGPAGQYFEKIWRFIRSVGIFAQAYLFIGCLIQSILNIYDFSDFMASLTTILFLIESLFGHLIIKKSLKRILYLYHTSIEIIEKSDCDVFDMKNDLKDMLKKSTRVAVFKLRCKQTVSVAIIFMVSGNIVGEGRDLPCFAWNPVDTTRQPMNFFMGMTQLVAISATMLFSSGQDEMYLTLIRLQIAHARYLCQYMPYIDRTFNNQPRLYYQNLKLWVNQHQLYLKISNVIREIYSPMLLLKYLVVFSFLFSCVLSVVTPTLDTTRKIGANVMSALHLITLYSFCALSDEFQNMNDELIKTSYSIGSMFNGKTLSKAVIVIQTMSNKASTFTLSAYGIYPLSKLSFGELFQATFSAILTMAQIQQANYEVD